MTARWDNSDLIIALKITARAAREQFQGIYDGRYKIAITAPPEDGKANKHLCAFLARTFGVAKKNILIESGAHSPLKIIRIQQPTLLPRQWELPQK